MNDQQQSRADALMDRIDDAIYRHIPPRVALENAKALYAMGIELLTAAPASANETGAEAVAVAYVCSASNDFAPIVRNKDSAQRLSDAHGDGKIVPLYAAPQPAQAASPAAGKPSSLGQQVKKAQADAPAEARAKSISDEMMDLADRLGSEWKDVDPRAWQHLLVYAPAEARLTDAARDMLAERRRQVEAEGWTPKHDDEHDKGEMARAAACYALHAGSCFAWRADAYQSAKPHEGNPAAQDSLWPWDMQWWKPKDPRRDLVRAGALILAELERLDRAALLNGDDNDR